MMRNQDHDNSLAVAIRKAFTESGMSIKRLADTAGLPYASVHGLIKKIKDPTLSTAALLCGVLGLELQPTKKTKQTKKAK